MQRRSAPHLLGSTFLVLGLAGLTATALVACGDDANVDVDTADTTDTTDTNDGSDTDTSDPGGVLPAAEPLVAKSPLGTHQCQVSRAMTRITDANYRIDASVAAGTRAIVTRAQPNLEAAEIGADGVVGRTLVLDPSEYAASQSRLVLDAAGTYVAAIWVHQDDFPSDGKLRFALFSASNLASVVARELPFVAASNLTGPSLTAATPTDTSAAFAMVWVEHVAAGGYRLAFARLATDGELVGEVVTLATTTQQIGLSPAIVATADGYAVLWTDGTWDASEVFFARLSPTGTLRFDPVRISRPAADGFTASTGSQVGASLLDDGDRTFAVFQESHVEGDGFEQHRSTVVQLAVLDSEGRGTRTALRAHEVDKTTEYPSLFWVGDQLGLLASRGTIIYICGGCITDYDAELLLIDPTALRLAAEPVRHVHQVNGMNQPRAVALDDGILVTVSLDFHALSYPATGAFTCTATP